MAFLATESNSSPHPADSRKWKERIDLRSSLDYQREAPLAAKRPRSESPSQPDKNTSWRTTLWQNKASTNHRWMAVLFGQVIALLAASTNAASFTLMNHFGIQTQFFQMLWMYGLLSFYFLSPRKDNDDDAAEHSLVLLPGLPSRHLKVPWWIYLGISLLDALPNFLTLLSFRYTSLTSTTLLGSLTVPSTMIFSRMLLAKSFGPQHFLGVCLCVVGGSLTVWSDDDQAASNPPPLYIGDILAVTADVIYGLGDTLAEYFIKHVDRREYLGMLGWFGMIQTGLFSVWLERDTLCSIGQLPAVMQLKIVGVFVWYTASVFGYYIAEARFLVPADATLLNLSLQASNLWAVLFSLTAFRREPPLLFFAALILVVLGVFCYEICGQSQQQLDFNPEERRHERMLHLMAKPAATNDQEARDLESTLLLGDVDGETVEEKVYAAISSPGEAG